MRRVGEALVKTTGAAGWLIRMFIRLAAGAALLFLVLFVVLGLFKGCGTVEEPPSVAEAPWAVQTSSLYYYAKEFSVQGDVPAIKDYWIFDGKRYHFYTGVKLFPPESYGAVAIINRVGKGVNQ